MSRNKSFNLLKLIKNQLNRLINHRAGYFHIRLGELRERQITVHLKLLELFEHILNFLECRALLTAV